jgi:hypothetical protein
MRPCPVLDSDVAVSFSFPGDGFRGVVLGDPVLGDDHAVVVEHRGEQLDLPVRHAAQIADLCPGQPCAYVARSAQIIHSGA